MAKNNKDFFKSKNSWSEIKDKLLGCYLTPYFQKVLMNRRPIYYVDCFAGKGKFDDGKSGSPLIALQARDWCLNKTGNENGKVDLSFIELYHAEGLRINITNFNTPYDQPTVHSCKYEDIIEILLQSKRGANVFLYIDPYGIRALDFRLFERINTYGFNSLEMLINFNTFGFFRDACRAMGVAYSKDEAFNNLDEIVEYSPTEINSSPQSVELLSQIAGGEYWKTIVERYRNSEVDGYTAEQAFSNEYKLRLRQRFSYVLDMPIRLKPGNRPKYRMIHVCNHQDGCFLMAENMLKRKDELFTNIQQNRQPSLFNYIDTITATVENKLITMDQIEKLLASFIAEGEETVGCTTLIANFFNQHGLLCEITMLHSTLENLEKRGAIDIIRTPPRSDTGKLSTFWSEKKNKRITIRNKQS